jgi:hypothetical protein
MTTKPGRLLAHLTYANLVSTAALLVALGAGTAYAANTVFSSDIVDGDVMHADLNATAVAGDNVVDGSLTLVDVAGADVATSVSVAKTKAGKCSTRTVAVAGAHAGQVAMLSPLGSPARGLVLSGARVSGPDVVAVDVCNVGKKTAKPSTIGVRVLTFD